jgi:hypothetical protein
MDKGEVKYVGAAGFNDSFFGVDFGSQIFIAKMNQVG